QTGYDPAADRITVTIADNGIGISTGLLEPDEHGVKRLFLENVSTKEADGRHTGYGCYIAHEIATQRCGWSMDAGNLPSGGAWFAFTIPHQG
ncbi:MAG TPA: ATP-binding protein, partial [Bacteroidota bacterium]